MSRVLEKAVTVVLIIIASGFFITGVFIIKDNLVYRLSCIIVSLMGYLAVSTLWLFINYEKSKADYSLLKQHNERLASYINELTGS